MSGLPIKPAAQDQRLQLLLAQQAETQARQAEIQAEIAALLPSSTSFQHHRSPIHKQFQQRQRDVPRSVPNNGATMARRLSSDRLEKSPSQRSTHSMTRTSSKGSSSARPGNPLVSGQMPPSFADSRRENAFDQPWSPYTYQLQHPPSQRTPDLEQVLENVGEDPAAWIYRTGGTPSLSLGPSPIPIPSSALSRSRPSFGTSPSSYGMPTPTTPTSGSLTNATTLTSNMSRQSSLCTEPLLESIEMLKFNSNNSSFPPDFSDVDQVTSDQIISHYPSHQTRRSSNEEQLHLLKGAGGVSHDSQFLDSFPIAEDVAQLQSSSFSGEKMEKSHSNESTCSSSSSSSRSKERLKAQVQTAAARPLAPKNGGDELEMSRSKSSQSMTPFGSRDGSQQDAIAAKPSYQRPKHDRVSCKECDDHPEGFRGEHELRRHQDRQHRKTVKKWICIQPSGLDHPKPAQSLSRCKACAQQKKKYNAYYNAAAHLRRAHFRPKPKGRAKTSKVDDAEKRGGKAGGDWPPMHELKHWMIAVEEQATDYPSIGSQQEDADVSEDEEGAESSPATMSSVAGGSFEANPFLMSDMPYNTYTSPTNSDMFSMQNMQYLDLPQHASQQIIDPSMTSGQNNFDTFSFPPNDHLAFSDQSHVFLPNQVFDDQLLGLDPVHFPFQ